MSKYLPVGKLPVDLLEDILANSPIQDESVVEGPGIGMDCAVVDNGDTYLVYKSDPITFATDEIGWYLVQINVNDIATTGATPRWLLLTMLLPEDKADEAMVRNISKQVQNSCAEMNVSLIGGHTEITTGLNRPILAGTMVGEVARDSLVIPKGARPGDRILLTKGVPIEGTAVLSREFPERMHSVLTENELFEAKDYLYNPGISVLRDSQIAVSAGTVHAMHDPTEGGLEAALWELAIASQCQLYVDPAAVHISQISSKICQAFEIDPLALIASGALLISATPETSQNIQDALKKENITCADIGRVEEGEPAVWQSIEQKREKMPYPQQDAIAVAYG